MPQLRFMDKIMVHSRPPPTTEKVSMLAQSLRSDSDEVVALALDHVALLMQDPRSTHTICEHPDIENILNACFAALHGPVGLRDDALGVLSSVLVVPSMRPAVWGCIVEFCQSADGAASVLTSTEMPRLVEQCLHGLEESCVTEQNLVGKQIEFLYALVACKRISGFEALAPLHEHLLETQSEVRLFRGLVIAWRSCVGNAYKVKCASLLDLFGKVPFSFHDTLRDAGVVADMVGVMTEALILPGAEEDAARALGNALRLKPFVKIVNSWDVCANILSRSACVLSRHSSNRATKMAIYVVWRLADKLPILMDVLKDHPQADFLTAGLIKCLGNSTADDWEAIGVLEHILKHNTAQRLVLRGGHVPMLLRGVCELLSHRDIKLDDPCCKLLQALADATEPATILSVMSIAPELVTLLSGTLVGRDILTALIPVLQWQPQLAEKIALPFKSWWIAGEIQRCAEKHGGPIHIVVHRKEIMSNLCEKLQHDSSILQRGINVQFRGDDESGFGDGHRREFFRLCTAELMNPDFGLFQSNDGGRSFHLNSMSAEMQPDHLEYLELCGKLAGLALLHRETAPAMRFTKALGKLVLGYAPLVLEDLASVDPDLYQKKVLYLLERQYSAASPPMALEDLELTFEDVPLTELFPNKRNELCPEGASMAVTEENMDFYLQLLCEHRLRGAVRRQLEALLRGFGTIIPEEVRGRMQRLVTPAEFELLLCGSDELDVAEWKANSVCQEGISREMWESFWRVIESMSAEQRGQVLEFVTGSTTVPAGGFDALSGYGGPGGVNRFTVAPRCRSTDACGLPTAATCFNRLFLPPYTSEETMRAALLEAVAHRHTGFSENAAAQ